MEEEWHHRNHTYMVTFSQVPTNVVKEMAKHLDTYGDASWEYLADWLGLPQLDIKSMDYRTRYTHPCSPSLQLFYQYCMPRDICVYCLLHGLEKIGNLACKRVLHAWLESYEAHITLNCNRCHVSSHHKPVMDDCQHSRPYTNIQLVDESITTNNCSQGLDLRNKSRPGHSGPVGLAASNCDDTKLLLPQDSSSAEGILSVDKWCEYQSKFIQSGSRDDSYHKSFVQDKRITHPFTEGDRKILEKEIGESNRQTRATVTDIRHSNFVQDSRDVRVFLTYTYDNKRHMKSVLQVCECLKKNNFSVGLDARESHLLREDGEKTRWHDMRYDKADYVLVLISPLYHHVVTGKTLPGAGTNNVLHARRIHDRMYAEYLNSTSNNHTLMRRFVPLIMSGAKTSDVPDWLLKSSQPFIWPQQFQHLMFHLIQPAQVIADYVSKRNHTFLSSRN